MHQSRSKAKEHEVPLHTLEDMARKGAAALVEYLREETGRSEKALTRLIEVSPETDEHTLLIACGQDETILQRVKPFGSLLRRDRFGQLVVIHTGSIYVTAGTDRRSTGTHYTPRSLTELIVKRALEPLVYVGPAEGLPAEEWSLKSSKEILTVQTCDMTMGSGAFLVEACRYLAERLVEAWENAEREHPGSFVVTPDGELSTGSPTERLIPADSAERVAIARRYVADRCLYGGAGEIWNPTTVSWPVPFLGLGLVWLLVRRPTRFFGVVVVGFYAAFMTASALGVYPLGTGRPDIFAFPVGICLFVVGIHLATEALPRAARVRLAAALLIAAAGCLIGV